MTSLFIILAPLVNFTFSVAGIYFNALELTFLPLILLSILFGFIEGKTRLKVKRKDLLRIVAGLSLIFMAQIIFSAYYADSTGKVLKEFFKWVEILGMMWLIFTFTGSEDRFKKMYWFLFSIQFSSIIIAIYRGMTTGWISPEGLIIRRVEMGHFSSFSICMLLPFLTSSWTNLLMTFLFITLILSMTRGSWFATFVIFLVFLIKSKVVEGGMRARRVALLSILLLTIIIFAYPMFREIIIKRTLAVAGMMPGTGSPMYRYGLIKIAFQAFSENPILGIGANNFSRYLIENSDLSFIPKEREVALEEAINLTPHNLFVQYLSELGIIGLSIFLAFMISIYKILKHGMYSKPDKYTLGLYLYFFGLMVDYALGFIAGRGRIMNGVYFGLVLSLLRRKAQ